MWGFDYFWLLYIFGKHREHASLPRRLWPILFLSALSHENLFAIRGADVGLVPPVPGRRWFR